MNRLLLYAMSIVMLGMLSTAWLDYRDFKATTMNSARRQESRNAANMRRNLDDTLVRLAQYSRVMALAPSFINALDPAVPGNERIAVRRELEDMFSDAHRIFDGVVNMILVDSGGAIVASSDDSGYRGLEPRWLGEVFSGVMKGYSQGEMGRMTQGTPTHYVMAEPVRIDSLIGGVLVVMVELRPIIDGWVELLPEIAGSFAAAVDKGGKLVGHTSQSELNGASGVAAELAAINGEPGRAMEVTLMGAPWLTAYSISNALGWKIITASPVNEILAPASHVMARSFAVHIAGALVSMGILLAAIRLLTRGLRRRLAAAMAEAGENLPARRGFLEEVDVLLGHMHKVMAAMRENVASTEKSRRDLAVHKERLENEVRLKTEELGRERLGLREAETALRLARNEAERSSRAKKDFLDRMSHEFRTPMNAIIGMSYLCRHTALDPKQNAYLSKIETSAGSLLAMINDVLDFSKLESGRMTLDKTRFSISESVANTYDMLQLKAAAKGLEFNTRLSPDLPEFVLGDSFRLSQILTNLASNAIKFTNAGRVEISVEVDSRYEGHVVARFTVSDTGIGIEPERLTAIFEAFSQADGYMTRKYEGTGLGLALCKSLVDLMGGRIWAESRPGQGSVFHCAIPFETGSEEDPAQGAPDACRGLERIRGSRILLVEDNETNQIIAREILERLGMSVETAANGQEALEALARERFAFVLMDIQMPVMDGLTAARKIRESSLPGAAELPIVAMTAHVQTYDREQSMLAGMNNHLTKPANPEELAAVLVELIKPGETCAQSAERPEHTSCDITEQSKQENGEIMFVPGIDTKSGLARVMGNEKLYKNLLQRLATKYDDTPDKIREALDKNDMETAVRLAHTLKGVAAGLGADGLALVSSDLEQGLKNNGAVESLLEKFSAELAVVVAAIIEAIGSGEAAPATAAPGPGLSAGELEAVRLFMEKLPDLAEMDFIAAQNGLNNLAGKLENSAAAAEYRALREALEDFELSAIRDKAQALLRKLGA